MASRTVSLTGWGRIAPTRAELAAPATVAAAARLLEPPARGAINHSAINHGAINHGVIPRGLGRSYNMPRSARAAW